MPNTAASLGDIRLDATALARALDITRPFAADLPAHLQLPETASCWVGREAPASIRLLPPHPTPEAAEAPLLWIDTADLSSAAAPHNHLRTPVIRTPLHSSEALERIRKLIDVRLDLARPGTLVQVYGFGVLIQGESGVGKSETALMLLERGHPLISDDAVRICAHAGGTLLGRPLGPFHGYLAVHGLGLLRVNELFGETAVASSAAIRLLVALTDKAPAGDPLHGAWGAHGWLGRELPRLTLFNRRPRALLIETAVRQMQARSALGHSAMHASGVQTPEPV